MNIGLLNLRKVETDYGDMARLDGKIEIDMVSIYATETMEEAVEEYRADLVKSGLAVGGFIETPADFVMNPYFDFAETNVYKAHDSENKMIDYEFWQTVTSAGDYYYFVSLLTPARDQDYFMWARNTQTYKLVIDMIEIEQDALSNR
jgi:hypothetical protein